MAIYYRCCHGQHVLRLFVRVFVLSSVGQPTARVGPMSLSTIMQDVLDDQLSSLFRNCRSLNEVTYPTLIKISMAFTPSNYRQYSAELASERAGISNGCNLANRHHECRYLYGELQIVYHWLRPIDRLSQLTLFEVLQQYCSYLISL